MHLMQHPRRSVQPPRDYDRAGLVALDAVVKANPELIQELSWSTWRLQSATSTAVSSTVRHPPAPGPPYEPG